MSGALLEPRLLVRAARHRRLTLSDRQAKQLSALLETSRGITVVGQRSSSAELARLLIDTAVDVGMATGTFTVDAASTISDVRQSIERGEWLLAVDVQPSRLSVLIKALEPTLAVRAKERTPRSATWRFLVVHDPTRRKRLPVPLDLMRHFPLFDAEEV